MYLKKIKFIDFLLKKIDKLHLNDVVQTIPSKLMRIYYIF